MKSTSGRGQFPGGGGKSGREGWELRLVLLRGNLAATWRTGPPPGLQFNPPLHTYGRLGIDPDYEGRAVIGGLVYRGTRYPELAGRYVFGDYISEAHLGDHFPGGRRLHD